MVLYSVREWIIYQFIEFSVLCKDAVEEAFGRMKLR